jgi:glycosyltransferase involved in cell wall biosynthesis
MAAGRPVVCLDLGGPALQVTADTGIKVPATSSAQVVNDLADAITLLARETALRVCMGEAARRRVQEYYSWEEKGDLMSALYEKASENK